MHRSASISDNCPTHVIETKTRLFTRAELSAYKLGKPQCGACPNFGKIWACPDFAPDFLARHDKPLAQITIIKIKPQRIQNIANSDNFGTAPQPPDQRPTPPPPPQPEKYFGARKTINAARKIFDPQFLELERNTPNSVALFAGSCLCRLSENCPRRHNRPCLFPDKMRTSLEALAYDVPKIAKTMGIEIQWQPHPDYYTLVYALLKNG